MTNFFILNATTDAISSSGAQISSTTDPPIITATNASTIIAIDEMASTTNGPATPGAGEASSKDDIYFRPLCGAGVLWDWDESWNTGSPRFSFCLLHSAPIWIPGLFLIIGVLASLGNLVRRRPFAASWRSFPPRVKFWLAVKLLLSCAIAAAAAALLSLHMRTFTGSSLPPFALVSPQLLILSTTLALFVAFREAADASFPLGLLLFFFWALTSSLQSVVLLQTLPALQLGSWPVASNLTSKDEVDERLLGEKELDFEYGVCAAIVSVASIAMFFLNCFNLSVPRSKSPFDKASTASRLVYAWITPFLIRGYKKELVQEDLDDIPPDCKSQYLSDVFHSRWRSTVPTRRANHGGFVLKSKNNRKNSLGVSLKSEDLEDLILDDGSGIKKAELRRSRGFHWLAKSACGTVLSGFKWNIFSLAMLQCLRIVFEIVKPLILGILLKHLERRKEMSGFMEEWGWKGVLYVITLTVCNFMEASTFVFYIWCGTFLGLKIDRTLKNAVFSKSLRLSVESRQKSTVGEMVNLINQDSPKFFYLIFFLEGLIIPAELVIYVYLLWQQLGPSFLTGLVLLCVLVPTTILITRKQKANQSEYMKIKDSRVKIINEILNGIQVLKLYAWEEAFLEKIRNVRKTEINMRKKVMRYDILNSFTTQLSAILAQAVSISVFALISGKSLSPEIVFVSLGLFTNLKDRLLWLPECIVQGVQVWVASKRIDKFMRREEYSDDFIEPINNEFSIQLFNGEFKWGDNLEPTLKSINFDLKKGESAMIVGQVGSGKSSFLMSLLGEMIQTCGNVYREKSVAFVGQQPWIQNASLRNNILFGKPLDEKRYQLVLEACALLPDLKVLPAGDETEIGEKGVNLSGGQKLRVALARAVYDNAHLYLLDDPLSAVDAHVGRHIFDRVIGPSGLLRNKSRVLVSNNLTFSSTMDKIVFLSEGTICEVGSYEELSQQNGYFSALAKKYKSANEENYKEHPVVSTEIEKESLNENGMLIGKEENQSGSVNFSVYWNFIKALGWRVCVGGMVSIFFCQLFEILIGIWLAKWTDDVSRVQKGNQTNSTKMSEHLDDRSMNTNLYVLIYNIFSTLACILVVGRRVADYIGTAKSSYYFHERLSTKIMQYPMSFFETTPLGRIINRFSSDIDAVDCRINTTLLNVFQFVIVVCLLIAVICFIQPWILTLVPVLFIFFGLLNKMYIPASRQVRRLKSTSLSFVLSHFSQTQLGLVTIRAFEKQNDFLEKWHGHLDEYSKTEFTFRTSNLWLSFFIYLTSTFVLLFCGLLSVLGSATTAGIIGVSLTFSFGVCNGLGGAIRSAAQLEQDLVSVERLEEFSSFKTEGKRRSSTTDGEIKSGCLDFENFSARYRENLDDVLKELTFKVKSGEKVGIVGRTGAGKSTITKALFRLIEASKGNIKIDSHDSSSMGLYDLRSSLSIIPQDAVVFSGTLRQNLDPFGRHDDATIWDALEMAHLKQFVCNVPERLNHLCAEYGSNLSSGQQQLLCLARALLRKSKILVLDEATAAVDLDTDDLIQATIRKEFKDCTVLTIAHRINTILDYDKILALDRGSIKEYDDPKALLRDESSMFYSLAKESGIV